jgi:NitT/TauT family transport system permease protein
MISRKRLVALMPWIVTIGLLLLWELVCTVFRIREFLLPAPTVVAKSLMTYWRPLLENSLATFATTLAGFGIAIAAGVVLGMAIGASTLVYSGLYPVLVAFNSVPKVAMVPLLVIWFGIGAVPAIITAFIIAFFPIAVNVATGLATIEPEMRDVLRSLGASKLEILTKVGIPRSLPYLFASLKVAITLAFVGSVLAETVAGNAGVGFIMMTASARFDVALVFAGLVVVAVMAIAMYAVCAAIERRMTRWAFRGQLVS